MLLYPQGHHWPAHWASSWSSPEHTWPKGAGLWYPSSEALQCAQPRVSLTRPSAESHLHSILHLALPSSYFREIPCSVHSTCCDCLEISQDCSFVKAALLPVACPPLAASLPLHTLPSTPPPTPARGALLGEPGHPLPSGSEGRRQEATPACIVMFKLSGPLASSLKPAEQGVPSRRVEEPGATRPIPV